MPYSRYICLFFVFFFKQKTAYEIKECDWSSDVCSPISKVDMMQDAEPFENVDRPIDRRLVDADTGDLLGALTNLCGIEMNIAARCQCIAHRPARRCDAQTFRTKVTNQRFGFHQGARKAGTPVIALPRISIWIPFVPS